MKNDVHRRRHVADLVFVIAFALAGTTLLVALDAFERFYRHSRRFEHLNLDEILAFLSMFFTLGLLWFAFRRNQDARREVTRRRQAEEDLSTINQELEKRVEERTVQLQTELAERRRTEERLMAYQNRLRSLSSELTLIEERERRRIAAELHDNLGHSLALAKNSLDHLKGALPRDQARQLVEANGLIEGLIRHTRELIFEVSPPILDTLPFEAAVEWLAENILEKNAISFRLEVGDKPFPLADDVRILVFRTIRELLINGVKHAKAHRVEISMAKEGEEIIVEIRDDGIGFDVSEDLPPPAGQQGFGLMTARERLAYLGGRISIISASGKGTSITLAVPLLKNQTEAS